MKFENPEHVSKGIRRIELDGEAVDAVVAILDLADDGKKHQVKVVMGTTPASGRP